MNKRSLVFIVGILLVTTVPVSAGEANPQAVAARAAVGWN